MAAKFAFFTILMVVARCSVVPPMRVDSDYTSFEYDVSDPNAGDYKGQSETRFGGNVAGQYSMLEADGTNRTVDYTADDVNSYNSGGRKNPAVVTTAPSTVGREGPAAFGAAIPASYSSVISPSAYSTITPSAYPALSMYAAPAAFYH